MKKISLIALASLIAFSGAASAQSFDLNSMPLGNIPMSLDTTATGSVKAAKIHARTVTRDGVAFTQYYTLKADGSAKVVSETQN